MNIHSTNYIGAIGIYPIEEIITNTSNNLINYNILTSNNLISYTNTTSNNLISYTNTTSNNITSYYNNLLNTTLPTNNITTNKETIIGNNYIWNETILEPLNHLSSIYQVQDNILPQQLDAYLSRYYYFNNNELKEAVSKTTLSSYTSTSYYEIYKKYFGYVGYNNTISGGIEMITNDTTQNNVNNATINLSIMLGSIDVSYPYNIYTYPYNAYCVFNIKWNGKNTARILFCGREVIGQGGYGVVQRFVRIQYIERNDIASISWRNNSSTPSTDDYIIPPEYYNGYNSYHYWSFNLQRDRWYIYLDGNLVLTSSTYSTTNFNFGITDLKLEDAHLSLNDVNKNKYQFADVYYFKRHLTNDEILSLSKYHLSQINNSLRVYSTIECDKIICNSIVDYDYTEKIYKPLTFGISQIKNLSTDLSNKEPLLNLTPDRVIVSDPNSQRGQLTTSSITSNNLEDMQNLIRSYNPVIEFIKDTFAADIKRFVDANPNIITLGVSAASALFTFFTGGVNAFNANNRIPRRYITEWQDTDGDLRIFYPNLLNDDHARIYITETFKTNHIYNKQPTITGGATTITDNNLTANRVLISNGDGKVATSNNIDLVKLSYLNDVISPIGASITSLQNAKQDNLSASSTSIITITNNVINSLWNKSGTSIYYTGGSIGIGTSTITSGYVLDVEGSTEMTNNTSLSDYTLLNPLLSSITKRYVFGFDGSTYAKELIQNIRYDYNGATYDTYQGINKYVGSISVNTGELYIFDDYIRTYPLDTQSCSFSFWWYRGPSLLWTGTEYASVVLFRIDQYRINLLYNQRRRVKISYKALTELGQNLYKISVEYATNQNDYFIRENDAIAGGQNNWAYSEKLSYIVPNENYFKTPKFLSFNITKTSCTLFINGVQVATNTFTAPNVEFRLEKFYFPQNADYENPNTMNQQFRFWGIYMNYNRLYTANEVGCLYRYETDTLTKTLQVNGMLKSTALSVGAIYVNEKIISIPDAYNQKSLYSQPQEINKITIQDKSNSVIALSIDAVEINSTSNLINNSGKAGFLFYPNNQNTTIADFKTLTISDVANLQTTLDGKEPSFTTLGVSKGGTNKSSYTQNRLLGCITSTTTIDEIQLGSGLTFSGSTLNLNIDQRFVDTSNYTLNTSNSISNRITGLSTLYAPISHNHDIANINGLSQEFINSSNYTLNTSNAISNRITNLAIANISGLSQEFINSSNYTLNTSNAISNRITNLNLDQKFIDTSNYVLNTSNTISNRITNLNLDQKFIDTSNYVLNTSNSISNRITNLNLDQKFIDTSNYVLNTSNSISNRITNLNLDKKFIDTSNYVLNTSNSISNRLTNFIASTWSTSANNYTTANVGIGTNTASATYKLDIQGIAPKIRIIGTGADDNAIIVLRELSDLYGFDISYIGNIDNKLYIRSYNNSATAVDRLSIDRNTGVVGIGTGTASRLLHLHNDALTAQTLIQFTDKTTTASGSRGCLIGKQTNNDMLIYNYQANANIILSTATTDGTPVNRLTITGNGLIGVNNATPQEDLHIHTTETTTSVYTQYTDGTTTASANRGTLIGKTSTQNFGFSNMEIGKNFSFYTTPTTQGVITERLRIENGKTYSFGNAVAICKTDNYGVVNNNMSAGSLTIGDISVNFGGGTTGWIANTAGLLMECTDNTEIAIHDSGNRVASFMYYEGGATNRFQIGRNMFWGNIGTIALWGNVGIGTATPSTLLDVVGGTPILTLRTSGNAEGKIYFGNSGHGVGRNPNLGTLNGGNDVGLWTTSASVGFCIGGTEYGRFNNGGGFLLSTYTGFANNTWNISRDTVNNGQRMYFSNNSTSYWKGFGSITNVFRNGSDGDIGYFSASDLYLNGGLYLGNINDITARAYTVSSSATNYWRIICDTVDGGGKNNTGNLLFYGNAFVSGFVEDDTGSYDAYNKMNFTGQHRTIADDKTLYSSNYDGYLVSTSGKYKALGSKYGRNNIKQNIITNDALPIVELTSKAYDPCVFGVITERTDDEYHQYKTGSFVSLYCKDGGDDRLIVNGCGEGSIWICNINGNLKNGDYLCSSDIAGIAMKQDDDLLHNYTCAKITMDCDFEPKLVPLEIVKYVEYTEYTSNYTSSNYQYFDETTSNMMTQHIDDIVISSRTFTSNILDIEGNPIYEYKLDESSNILYDYEYEVKTVIHNNIEYKMAFVGCTYKMS
jgi:hypothetical protein